MTSKKKIIGILLLVVSASIASVLIINSMMSKSSSQSEDGIPVYSIIFGEGDAEEMNAILSETGGKTFDASSQSLSSVFKEIRGYL